MLLHVAYAAVLPQIEAVDAVVLGGIVGIVVDAASGDDGDVAVLAHVEGVVHDVLQARLRHDDGDVHRLALGAVRDADVDAGVVGLGGNVDVGRGMALDQFAVLAHVEGALRHAVHIGDLGEQVLVDGGKINGHSCLLLQLEKTCGGREGGCFDRASSADGVEGGIQWGESSPVAFDTIEDCLSESEYPAVRPHW